MLKKIKRIKLEKQAYRRLVKRVLDRDGWRCRRVAGESTGLLQDDEREASKMTSSLPTSYPLWVLPRGQAWGFVSLGQSSKSGRVDWRAESNGPSPELNTKPRLRDMDLSGAEVIRSPTPMVGAWRRVNEYLTSSARGCKHALVAAG